MSKRRNEIRQKLLLLVAEMEEEYDVPFQDFTDVEDLIDALADTLEDIAENPEEVDELDFENPYLDPDDDSLVDDEDGDSYLLDDDLDETDR